jgi:deoxyribodipyrimidine photo-lyase
MVKRASSLSPPPPKKPHLERSFDVLNVASPEAAAAADADPPLRVLLRTMENALSESPEKGDAVAYWMRMEDMRSESTLRPIPCLLKFYR